MSYDTFTEVLMLQLRNAISNKEFCITSANREVECGGDWLRDWNAEVQFYNAEIDNLVSSIRSRIA